MARATAGLTVLNTPYAQVACDNDMLIEEELSCEGLQELDGCVSSPDAVDVADVAEYIEAVHDVLEELDASCPAFAEVDWFVDCEDLPCVLGLPTDQAPLDHFGAVTCGHTISKVGISVRTGRLGGENVAMLPLLFIDSAIERELWRRWEHHPKERTFRVGFHLEQGGPPM